MEPIIKYRFDKEMVAFVKKLDIKTSMFGFDKGDVYSKFKDLLIHARDVCEQLVEEQHRSVEKMKSQLIEAAEDPSKLEALLAKWKSEAEPTEDSFADDMALEELSESKESAEAIESSELGETCREADQTTETAIDQVGGRVVAVESGISAEKFAELEETHRALLEEHENLTGKLSETTSKLEELQTQLQVFKEREEELSRTADILREARLEGDAIISSARTRAEQELFLYRAKRRDEEKAFDEVIKGLESKKTNLVETCALYKGYVEEGQNLFDQLREYADRFERPSAMNNTSSERFDARSGLGLYPITPAAEVLGEPFENNEDDVRLPWEAQEDIPYCEGDVCLFDVDTRDNALDRVWELNEQALEQSMEPDLPLQEQAGEMINDNKPPIDLLHEPIGAWETGPYCEGGVCSFDADRENPQHEKLWSTGGGNSE